MHSYYAWTLLVVAVLSATSRGWLGSAFLSRLLLYRLVKQDHSNNWIITKRSAPAIQVLLPNRFPQEPPSLLLTGYGSSLELNKPPFLTKLLSGYGGGGLIVVVARRPGKILSCHEKRQQGRRAKRKEIVTGGTFNVGRATTTTTTRP
jgi:hypothetical protein